MGDAEVNSYRAKASGGDINLVCAAEQRERHHSRGVGGARQEEREAEGQVLALIEDSHGGARHVEGQRQLEADCSITRIERSTKNHAITTMHRRIRHAHEAQTYRQVHTRWS